MNDIEAIAATKITWICRFHPTDSWHEVGCPHQEWTKEQLQAALESKKRFDAWSKFPERAVTAEAALKARERELAEVKQQNAALRKQLYGVAEYVTEPKDGFLGC